MTTDHGFNYMGYRLCCDPMPMADGRFGAQVVIEAGHGGPEVQAMRFPALEYFATEEEAVEFARRAGVRWVDEYG